MSLGRRAEELAERAKLFGHRLSKLEQGHNPNGMMWSAVCRVCGAMAIAEFDAHGNTVVNGNTQRMSCSSVLRKKARAKELREERA